MRRTTVTLTLTTVLLAVALCAAAASSKPICVSQRDACVDRLVAEMQQGVDRLGCDHGAPFAYLYERTTEGIREALQADAFSDRPLWNQVTTAFGRYYLDAAAAWREGHRSRVPKAWRLALAAARDGRVVTLGDVFLGINAHINRDLAYVYARFGVRRHEDHLVINGVLASVQSSVLPELIARYDPTLAAQRPADPALSLDIFAWRERAWRNAKRLRTAPSRSARQRVAARIERRSSAKARQIRAAFPATADEGAARDAYCDSVSTP
jgi:Family of unknown function (DUF5995)